MRSVPCRYLLVGALLLTATAPASAQPTWNTLPGEFAFRTLKGFYVGALSGGGLSTEPTIVTGATKAGSWEKFRIKVMDPPAPHDKAIQTSSGNYVTAVSGGGRNSDVMHTDATQTRAWEQFRIYDLRAGGVAPTYFALQTLNNHYVTAVGQGGKYEDAIHTDATSIGSWEYFRIVKCGDLGSDTEYTILSPNDQALTAVEGGGIAETGQDPLVMGYWPGDTLDRAWARFKFIRQSDGTYALQTANSVNYLTALQGGGLVQKYFPPDCGLFEACIASFSRILHTDATRVQAWEKFRFIDQGDCKYAIQTTSGFFAGIYTDSHGVTLMTTRRSDVVTDTEKFQLVPYGLASPVVFN